MTKRERVLKTLQFEEVDSIPTLGGWITSAAHLQALSGVPKEEFWKHPRKYAIAAYKRLEVDALAHLCLPRSQEDHRVYAAYGAKGRGEKYSSPEDVAAYIKSLDTPSTVEKNFDSRAFYNQFVAETLSLQRELGEIAVIPDFWNAACHWDYYLEFGYENFLVMFALYPELMKKLYEVTALGGYLSNIQIAKAVKDHNFVPMMLVGADICTTKGPMVSPSLLEEIYFPHAKMCLKPLHDAGIKTIWHSDGNILPILNQVLDLGVSGFQGFQEEIGVHIADLQKMRTKSGERLIFWGSFSVSSLLPYGSVEDIKRQKSHCIEVTGGKGLFIFPANTIGPEVPLENIFALYEHTH